jgi:hypothetical protein
VTYVSYVCAHACVFTCVCVCVLFTGFAHTRYIKSCRRRRRICVQRPAIPNGCALDPREMERFVGKGTPTGTTRVRPRPRSGSARILKRENVIGTAGGNLGETRVEFQKWPRVVLYIIKKGVLDGGKGKEIFLVSRGRGRGTHHAPDPGRWADCLVTPNEEKSVKGARLNEFTTTVFEHGDAEPVRRSLVDAQVTLDLH